MGPGRAHCRTRPGELAPPEYPASVCTSIPPGTVVTSRRLSAYRAVAESAQRAGSCGFGVPSEQHCESRSGAHGRPGSRLGHASDEMAGSSTSRRSASARLPRWMERMALQRQRASWAWSMDGGSIRGPKVRAARSMPRRVTCLISAGHTPAKAEAVASSLPAWRQAPRPGVTAFAKASAKPWREFNSSGGNTWTKSMRDVAERWSALCERTE